MKYFFTYKTTIGNITIAEEDNHIIMIKFKEDVGSAIKKETPLIKEAINQLSQYFEGKRQTFDLPLRSDGTDFQQKVWAALQRIPYGQVWSYKRLAEEIGNPKACRAVGMANNRNPISIVVPCHRVIGSDGSLVGYASGIENKRWLLELEQKNFIS